MNGGARMSVLVIWSLLVFMASVPAVMAAEAVSSPADSRWFVYEMKADFTGSAVRSSGEPVSGRYKVVVEDGRVVSHDGMLNGNLRAAIADQRAKELGFFGFLDGSQKWEFKYWSMAGKWFYGHGRVVGKETVEVAAGSFVDTVKVQRTIDSNYDNTTTYWYSPTIKAVIKLHHRMRKPNGDLVREIYYELAEYGPPGRR